MTNYFVGIDGDNGNSGLTWALRKETFAGAEAVPPGAGDTVYIGPGTYRGFNNISNGVSGTSGNPITYVGDITGRMTDGIGGVVRLTGSTDDVTEGSGTVASSVLISYNGQAQDYRTFRGLLVDGCWAAALNINSDATNWIIEDCVFASPGDLISNTKAIDLDINYAGESVIIRRCIFTGSFEDALQVINATERSIDLLIENCVFFGNRLTFDNIYGWTIKNCSFLYNGAGNIRTLNITGGNNCYVYNSLFLAATMNINAASILVSDYNVYHRAYANTPGTNVSMGANSDYNPIHLMPPVLIDEFEIPKSPWDLAPWSTLPALGCGQSPPSEDLFGITRPTSDAKKTRGAIQFSNPERETTIVYGDSPESIKFADAMATQMLVPVTGATMSFKCRVRREEAYAGTLPQMIIKH